MSIETLYKMSSPYSMTQYIEVYGDPENAWYEWRIVGEDGRIIQDTGKEGSGSFRGRQYGNSGIALRDALMVETGLDDPHLQEMQRIEDEGPQP